MSAALKLCYLLKYDASEDLDDASKSLRGDAVENCIPISSMKNRHKTRLTSERTRALIHFMVYSSARLIALQILTS